MGVKTDLIKKTLVKKVLEAIDREMIIQNVSRAEVARRLGVSRTAMTTFMSRKNSLSIKKIVDVCEALGLSVDITVSAK